MSVHVFGIRHHGPGSARSLEAALDALEPDAILVEGPPDANDAIPLCTHAEMRPPVALLVHAPADSKRAVFYPFAEFSPEWVALRRGVGKGIAVRFIDLPQANRLAFEEPKPPERAAEGAPPAPRDDPLSELARAAGFDDGERWWERMVEERGGDAQVFDAVSEAMGALRAELALDEDLLERRREAHMRRAIRAAVKDGFERIAVVCGAWHAPVLREPGPARGDDELLRDLPRVKVSATWVPWTYARLALESGYGAGIESPGWYRHLWSERSDAPTKWLVRTARLLREKDLDASSAHVIEAVRLAECLSALRGRPLVGLTELSDATEAVLLSGNPLPLLLIRQELLVGDELGSVPRETPLVPLQGDIEEAQRRLRMPARADEKAYDLDLRTETGLERSRLLHRLLILGIEWGKEDRVSGKRGTFHEAWKVQWDPHLAVAVIEASVWGSTVEEAAAARARDSAHKTADLAELCRILDRVLLADLPAAVGAVLRKLDDIAAEASSAVQLLDALPPLANALRYGNVRGTSAELIEPIVGGLVARACVGLRGACASLDDEAAQQMFTHLSSADQAIQLLDRSEHAQAWREALLGVLDLQGAHGLVAGRAARILLDAKAISTPDAAARFQLAVSPAVVPSSAAAWIEGFLRGSGVILLHSDALWDIVDGWIASLPPERFIETLPLLRRTFSTFPPPERRSLGERARRESGGGRLSSRRDAQPFDEARAAAALPLLEKLLGLDRASRPGEGGPGHE